MYFVDSDVSLTQKHPPRRAQSDAELNAWARMAQSQGHRKFPTTDRAGECPSQPKTPGIFHQRKRAQRTQHQMSFPLLQGFQGANCFACTLPRMSL